MSLLESDILGEETDDDKHEESERIVFYTIPLQHHYFGVPMEAKIELQRGP